MRFKFSSGLLCAERDAFPVVSQIMPLSLVLLQLATAQAPTPLPDIELSARVRAREVLVRQEGEAHLSLKVEPGVAPPIEVKRSAPPGAQRYRNFTIDLRAAARIADPVLSPQGNTNESTPQ